MDHDAVEVNAAASGTLIDKHDGESLIKIAPGFQVVLKQIML
jgi:hypothetical protein